MPPILFYLLLLRFVYGSLPQSDNQSKPNLTVSQQVNVSTLFTTNPLLKKLSMFSDSSSSLKPRSLATPTPPPIDKKILARSPGDNFNALYKRLNETLFSMAESETNKELLEDSTEEEPFAVTETLLNSLQPGTDPSTTEAPWDLPSWTNQPPATRTFSPLPEAESLPPLEEPLEMITQDEVKEVQRAMGEGIHEGEVTPGTPIKSGLAPLHRASEWQVQNTGNGRYLVSGTQFYEDNRIDGGVMVEEHRPPGNQLEVEDIRNDKRFAVEAELTKIRAHAAALKKKEKPIARGSKTLAVESSMILTDPKIDRFPERIFPSKTEIVDRNGRKIEIRKIDRRGKEVQVELSNPLLWNHDFISAPGAIIHGTLKKQTKKFKLASFARCFESIENTKLVGVIPIDRKLGNSPKECLKFCSKSPNCRTVVFEENLSMCEIFAEKPGEGKANFQAASSSILFEPIVEDPESCLFSLRAKAKAAPTVIKKKKKYEKEEEEEHCLLGEEHILTRQEGVRAVNAQWKEKFTTNEDDCVSACLTGPRKCVAAGYSHETQECILYSRTNTKIEVHEPTTLYSKMCVSEKTAIRCSGATIDHVKQAVLLGSIRAAKSVHNRTACIDACIGADFSCLSIMFYPKEKTNCILNDGSLTTAPDSFVEELHREVEYFGVEECYGIQDVTHQNNFIVEDDIRPGQITPGSRVETLRS